MAKQKKRKRRTKKTAKNKRTKPGGKKLKRRITLSHPELVERLEATDKAYLTTNDVQKVFGCHEVSVYRWVNQGRLQAYRLRATGKANRYKREDVRRLIDERFAPRPVTSSSQTGEAGDDDGGTTTAEAEAGKRGDRRG